MNEYIIKEFKELYLTNYHKFLIKNILRINNEQYDALVNLTIKENNLPENYEQTRMGYKSFTNNTYMVILDNMVIGYYPSEKIPLKIKEKVSNIQIIPINYEKMNEIINKEYEYVDCYLKDILGKYHLTENDLTNILKKPHPLQKEMVL